MTLIIRPALAGDADAIWEIIAPAIRGGEVFALPRDGAREAMLAYWSGPGHRVFVAAEAGRALGVFYLRANQQGGGSHVANAGYATHPDASRRGVARAMGLRSLDIARESGFLAMQFNFVVATNARAAALWASLGFVEIARLPLSFRHPRLGLVDALVLHRTL